MIEEKAKLRKRETEEMLGEAALIKVKVKPINHLWAPLVQPGAALGGGRLLWAGMLGGPKAGL